MVTGTLPAAQRHQLQLLRQRVRMLNQQLQRCVAAHSKLLQQLQTAQRDADERCARLQQQVQVTPDLAITVATWRWPSIEVESVIFRLR